MPGVGETSTPVVLHFRDGMTERVHASPDIRTDGESIMIRREDGGTEDVSLGELKAIFFLSPLPGDDEGPEGKALAVEFQDGEVIRGTSAQYSPQQSGFFLYPADRSKNDRIFVVNSAVLSIEVERF